MISGYELNVMANRVLGRVLTSIYELRLHYTRAAVLSNEEEQMLMKLEEVREFFEPTRAWLKRYWIPIPHADMVRERIKLHAADLRCPEIRKDEILRIAKLKLSLLPTVNIEQREESIALVARQIVDEHVKSHSSKSTATNNNILTP